MPPHEPEPFEADRTKSRKQLLQMLAELRAEVDRLNELLAQYEQAPATDPSAPQPLYPGVDTSERSKRYAELQLRKYFNFMQVVTKTLNDGVYGISHKGHISFLNDAAARMLGWRLGEVMGRPAHGLLHGKNADGSVIPVEECPLCTVYINGATAHSEEAFFTRRDNSTLLVSYLSLPLLNRDGVSGAVVGFHNITDRKQLEAELRQSEHDANVRANQLEANLMAVTDAMLVYDRRGRIKRANPAARELFGLDALDVPTELQARFPRYNSVDVNGQPIELAQAPLSRILAGETLTNEASVDVYMQRPDGTTLRINISGAPVRNDAGELDGAVCIVRNVTHLRRREERVRDGLHAVLQLLESLLDSGALPDASAGPATQSLGKRLVDLTRSLLDCRIVGVTALIPSTDNAEHAEHAEHAEQMRPLAVAGLTPEYEQEWRKQISGATLENYFSPASIATLRAGKPVSIDITQQPPLAGGRSVFGIRKLLACPLHVHGTLVGVLGLEYADADRARTANVELLRMVSRIAALLITRYADGSARRDPNADH